MDSDYYTSDDEKQDEINIDEIPKEVIRIYENACKKNILDAVSGKIIYLLEEYDISRRVLDFEEEVFGIYHDVVENYMYWEAPGEILNGNNYDLSHKFLQWIYSNTDKGIELEYLEQIYLVLTS